MSAETTTQDREDMDCREVADRNVTERYLRGALTPSDQDAFERHYLSCAHCFDDLRTVEALRAELGATGRTAGRARSRAGRPILLWLSAAAVTTAAVSLGIWLLRAERDSAREAAAGPTGPAAGVPATGIGEAPVVPTPVRPVPLTELARFDPPAYKALVLRGVEDEARVLFAAAMEHYTRKAYPQAVEGLRASVARNPRASDAGFFLGVSLLLTGKSDEGIAELKRTIAIGDSPYLEDTHYYLAKGMLQKGDAAGARDTLRSMIALGGDRQREAKRLLTQIECALSGGC